MGRDDRYRRTIAHYTPPFASALLLHALVFAVAAGWLTWTSSSPRPRIEPGPTVAVFTVAPEDARFPGLNPLDKASEWLASADAPATPLDAAFTFDVARIAAHAEVLFPFLTPGLAWEHFAPLPELNAGTALPNPFAAARARDPRVPAARPLNMDEAALQRTIDKAWSRRHRWEAFRPIEALARTYSADAGALPAVLQRYCDQNSLQPYADTTIRDPRLWVQLGIAADHVDFIGFIRRYVSEHPSTRATTALLFLLDSLAQGNRDALTPLIESDPIGEWGWTRRANPDAYRLVTRLRRHYKSALERRGLTSRVAINAYYQGVRLTILKSIVRTTPNGYRASDARFLIGAIYWRQQRAEEALRSWRAMTIDPDDSHVGAYSQILRLLQTDQTRASDGASPIHRTVERDINQILKNENGRWLMFSYDRLERFGYRFDTF